MLELINLNKKRGSLTVLANISLNLAPGGISIFLGHSGVGKSTLLRVVNGLEEVDSGELLFDGKPLDCATSKRRSAGMVFQDYNLFIHLTAEENLTLPLIKVAGLSPDEAKARAVQLLENYGLGGKGEHYPHQFSGGQKQRLAIARAAAMEPAILCMDEPTAALDPKQTRAVTDHIARLAAEGKILLIATHDTAILQLLDAAIYLMEGGRFVESCRTAQFFKDERQFPLLAAYLKGER